MWRYYNRGDWDNWFPSEWYASEPPAFYSMASESCDYNFESIIFKRNMQIGILNTRCEIIYRWKLQNLTIRMSTLVQVVLWRRQAITWANFDPDLCRHAASLGYNVFIDSICYLQPQLDISSFDIHFIKSGVCWVFHWGATIMYELDDTLFIPFDRLRLNIVSLCIFAVHNFNFICTANCTRRRMS